MKLNDKFTNKNNKKQNDMIALSDLSKFPA